MCTYCDAQTLTNFAKVKILQHYSISNSYLSFPGNNISPTFPTTSQSQLDSSPHSICPIPSVSGIWERDHMSQIAIVGTLHALIYFSSTYIVQALAAGSIENCFLQACYIGHCAHLSNYPMPSQNLSYVRPWFQTNLWKTSRLGSGIVGVKSLQIMITQSQDCATYLHNLQIGVQFPDSENAQCNLTSS